MIPRRYEINDEQRETIKDIFPPYLTGRPSKIGSRTTEGDKCNPDLAWIRKPGHSYDAGFLFLIIRVGGWGMLLLCGYRKKENLCSFDCKSFINDHT